MFCLTMFEHVIEPDKYNNKSKALLISSQVRVFSRTFAQLFVSLKAQFLEETAVLTRYL